MFLGKIKENLMKILSNTPVLACGQPHKRVYALG
jgi:hypothetical protein